MYGLEYLMLFGVPENKWELWDGRVRWAFPFPARDVAEAHFQAWTETLRRWYGSAGAETSAHEGTTTDGTPKRVVRFGDAEMSLYPRPIDLRVPVDGAVFESLYFSFWRRDLWPGQDPGRETGWESLQRHFDVELNLRSLFSVFCHVYGGKRSGRVAIALDDRNAVEPDHYYFQAGPDECMIGKHFFQGVPRLVAEVLSAATRALDRGPRMEVYRRAGVPHLWLLDPETETVEEYLASAPGRAYSRIGQHGPGACFQPALFPERWVEVDALFDTQEKRHGLVPDPAELESVPEWLISPETRIGLEILFFFGHPEHRYEIWDNRAPCLLSFGSSAEAEFRFGHFLEDLCRWEQVRLARPAPIEPGIETAEAGRFRLTRRGRQVCLDVAVDARQYRALLRVWAQREAWDWGGD